MSDVINVGQLANSLDTAPAWDGFTGVRLWYDDESYYFSGDESGRVMEADNPWATQEMADAILANLSGYQYQPFSAKAAALDPLAELGDIVEVGGVYGPLAEISTTYDAMCLSDIGAPADEEVDHEYTYESPTQRALNRKVTVSKSYHGVKITKAKGMEVVKTAEDGTETARAALSSEVLAFYDDDGKEALYFDSAAGRYRFRGDVEIIGGTMNINGNFIVDAAGNLTLNGNINLSGGTITWGSNKPASGISSAQAQTLIDNTLVSSPNIAGGKFLDLNKSNWIDMGTPTGSVAYFRHFTGLYSNTDPLLVMGYYSGNWVMAPCRDIVMGYVISTGKPYLNGPWDLSQATITYLNAGSSATAFQIRVGSTIWTLDETGWHT